MLSGWRGTGSCSRFVQQFHRIRYRRSGIPLLLRLFLQDNSFDWRIYNTIGNPFSNYAV